MWINIGYGDEIIAWASPIVVYKIWPIDYQYSRHSYYLNRYRRIKTSLYYTFNLNELSYPLVPLAGVSLFLNSPPFQDESMFIILCG